MRKKEFALCRSWRKGFAHHDKGFTLLELIVVIFIISLFAALVFPAFRTDSGRVKSDARKLSSLLRHLNDDAIAAKRVYSLKFDLDTHAVEWDGPEGERKDSIDSLESVLLPSKGTVREGELKIFAGPSGFSEHIEINLSEGEQGLVVEFNPISGRTKIKENEK